MKNKMTQKIGKILGYSSILQTSEAKTNSIVFEIAGKGRNSVLHHNFAQEFVPLFTYLIPFEGEKQAHVVSSRGIAYLWEKILQVNLKIRGVRDTLSSVNLGRKKYELRMWF